LCTDLLDAEAGRNAAESWSCLPGRGDGASESEGARLRRSRTHHSHIAQATCRRAGVRSCPSEESQGSQGSRRRRMRETRMGQTIGALLCCSLIAVVALWGRSRILVGERSRSFARTAPARQPSVMLDRRQLARLDRGWPTAASRRRTRASPSTAGRWCKSSGSAWSTRFASCRTARPRPLPRKPSVR